MSFVDIDIDNVVEYKSMPAAEYQVRILDAEVKDQKPEKGIGKFIQLKLEVVGEDEAKDIYHVMMLPTPQDDKKKANNRKLAVINLMKAMGREVTSQFDPKDWIGETAWVLLEEETDPEYGTKNRVRRFVVPA
uniref:Uncharacterized protein n=1 Tax=viral metagenome TaxID=1070528 RepID=A0A6M3JVH3_9ZZZZ